MDQNAFLSDRCAERSQSILVGLENDSSLHLTIQLSYLTFS